MRSTPLHCCPSMGQRLALKITNGLSASSNCNAKAVIILFRVQGGLSIKLL